MPTSSLRRCGDVSVAAEPGSERVRPHALNSLDGTAEALNAGVNHYKRRRETGIMGERLCVLCKRYRHHSECIQLGKKRKSGLRRTFCLICFEQRRPEIIEVVTKAVVEAWIKAQESVE